MERKNLTQFQYNENDDRDDNKIQNFNMAHSSVW